MKLKNYVLLIPLLTAMSGCVKDRDVPVIPVESVMSGPLLIQTSSTTKMLLKPNDLVINEFLADQDKTLPNQLVDDDYGMVSDWVELFNSRSDSAIVLYAGYWFLTDNLDSLGGFKTPANCTITIPPRGHYIFFCDDSAVYKTALHTNFGLSKHGEAIGISYSTDGKKFTPVDSYTFPAQSKGVSTGRYPDGSNSWYQLINPTPREANVN